MLTWAQIALAVLKLINWITGTVSEARWKKAGRDEVAAKTNAETAGTQDEMDQVSRPSDAAVADSMRRHEF